MVLKDAEVIAGMSQQAMDEVVKIAEPLSFEPGQSVITQGELADSLYILEEGSLTMRVSGLEHGIYQVSEQGAMLGWSSMAGRSAYTASAQCTTPVKVVKLSREKLDLVLSQYPADGMLFYKQLSRVVADRMIVYYHALVRAVDSGGHA